MSKRNNLFYLNKIVFKGKNETCLKGFLRVLYFLEYTFFQNSKGCFWVFDFQKCLNFFENSDLKNWTCAKKKKWTNIMAKRFQLSNLKN